MVKKLKTFTDLTNALNKVLSGKYTTHIPARRNEDVDMILAEGIKEHSDMKDLLILIHNDLEIRAENKNIGISKNLLKTLITVLE